jgi:hypothetical protein
MKPIKSSQRQTSPSLVQSLDFLGLGGFPLGRLYPPGAMIIGFQPELLRADV